MRRWALVGTIVTLLFTSIISFFDIRDKLCIEWPSLFICDMRSFGEGVVAFNKGDNDTAFAIFSPLAEAGDHRAQHYLGWMYANGLGVRKNEAKMEEWYHKSAKAGNVGAQHDLGWIYYWGIGVTKDYNKAEKWMREAAEKGHPGAQYVLGLMYEVGNGVSQDPILAYMWYNLASLVSNYGHTIAVDNRDRLSDNLSDDAITEAKQLSANCLAEQFKNCD